MAKISDKNWFEERARHTMATLRSALLAQGFGILEGTGIKGFMVYIGAEHSARYTMKYLAKLDKTMKVVSKLCSCCFHLVSEPHVCDYTDKRFLMNVLSAQ